MGGGGACRPARLRAGLAAWARGAVATLTGAVFWVTSGLGAGVAAFLATAAFFAGATFWAAAACLAGVVFLPGVADFGGAATFGGATFLAEPPWREPPLAGATFGGSHLWREPPFGGAPFGGGYLWGATFGGELWRDLLAELPFGGATFSWGLPFGGRGFLADFAVAGGLVFFLAVAFTEQFLPRV